MVPAALVVVRVLLAALGISPGVHCGHIDHLCGSDDEWTDDGRRCGCEERDTVLTEAQTDVSRGKSDPQPEGPGEGVGLRRHHRDAWSPGPARVGCPDKMCRAKVPGGVLVVTPGRLGGAEGDDGHTFQYQGVVGR